MTYPNIFYISPFAHDMRYGKEINKHIELLPDDAWIVLMDYDAMFLSPNYGRIISNAIAVYGDETDLFTCETNRLGSPSKCYGGMISNNDSINFHIKVAQNLELTHGHSSIESKNRNIAGMFMCFPKRVWNDNKFDDLKIIDDDGKDRKSSFDVRWCRGVKGSIKIIKGLYLWHTYRIWKHKSDTFHLED